MSKLKITCALATGVLVVTYFSFQTFKENNQLAIQNSSSLSNVDTINSKNYSKPLEPLKPIEKRNSNKVIAIGERPTEESANHAINNQQLENPRQRQHRIPPASADGSQKNENIVAPVSKPPKIDRSPRASIHKSEKVSNLNLLSNLDIEPSKYIKTNKAIPDARELLSKSNIPRHIIEQKNKLHSLTRQMQKSNSKSKPQDLRKPQAHSKHVLPVSRGTQQAFSIPDRTGLSGPKGLLGPEGLPAAACDVGIFHWLYNDELVTKLQEESKSCVETLFDYEASTTPDYVLRESNMIFVANKLEELAPSYQGSGDLGFENLITFLRAGFYVEYNSDGLTYSSAPASATGDALSRIADFTIFEQSTNDSHGRMLIEYFIAWDSIEDYSRSVLPISIYLWGFTEQHANSDNHMRAMVSALTTVYYGHLFGSTAFANNETFVTDLANFMLRDFLLNNSNWHYQTLNALHELGRMLEINTPYKSFILNKINEYMNLHSYLSHPWVDAASYLHDFEDCNNWGVCGFREAWIEFALGNYDCTGVAVKIRAQDMSSADLLHTCDEHLNRQQYDFHKKLETQKIPVFDDHNTHVEMIVFDDWTEYNKYGWPIFQIDTNNGGMYIEGEPSDPNNIPRIFMHEADWARPTFAIWNLEHEFVHYLDGRYNLWGSFEQQPLTAVWWTEGMAEYVSKGDHNLDALDAAATYAYNLSDLYLTTYENGDATRVYAWGYLASRFMMERHWEDLKPMLEDTRTGFIEPWMMNYGNRYDSEFNSWLGELIDGGGVTFMPCEPRRIVSGISLTLDIYRDLCFYLEVPDDGGSISVTTSAEPVEHSGDLDLYLHVGSMPTPNHYDEVSFEADSNESIIYTATAGSKVYIVVDTMLAEYGATLTISHGGTSLLDSQPISDAGNSADTCDTTGFETNTGNDLVAYIRGSDFDCVNALFQAESAAVSQIFTEENMALVASAVEGFSTRYTGNNQDGILELMLFLRAGYFKAFYDPLATGEYGILLESAIVAALDAFIANEHYYTVNDIHGDILIEFNTLIDSAEQQDRYLPVVKEWLSRYDSSFNGLNDMNVAFNRIFTILYRGQWNEDFESLVKRDSSIVDALNDFINNNTQLHDSENENIIVNAGREMTRLLRHDSLKSLLRPKVKAILDTYTWKGTGSWLWLVVADLADFHDGDNCAYYNICNFEETVANDVLQDTQTCANGTMIRAQDMTVAQLSDSCALVEAQETYFHQKLETNNTPVADDFNDTLEMVIFDNDFEYSKYGGPIFSIDTNNGGIYIEGDPSDINNQARFYAYEADWLLPEFVVWNLEHEFVHYLDGRYNLKGSFLDAMGETHKNIWWTEGLAEYISKKDCNADAQALAQQGGVALSTVFENTYANSADRVYRWAYLAVRYMFEQQPADINTILAYFRAGDYGGQLNFINALGTSYDADWYSWLPSATCDAGSDDGLQNGQPLNSLSGNQSSETFFYVNIPAGASNLVISISGGSGDADLYTRFGSQPNTSSYDCRPYIGGNDETCTVASPSEGQYHIMLRGYQSYSGVTLTATFDAGSATGGSSSSGGSSSGGSGPGLSETGLSGAAQSQTFYVVDVPSGATELVISTSGGSGDVDLYTRFDSQPSISNYDCRPYKNGNNETCTEDNPGTGQYHIMLRGYNAYSGVELNATFQ